MPLSTEQLMIPRVIVRGGPQQKDGDCPFPGCLFGIGDVLIYDEYRSSYVDVSVGILRKEADKFPHIFEPLPWWSHRDISDLPEYIKIGYYDEPIEIVKVAKWVLSPETDTLCEIGEDRWEVGWYLDADFTVNPATQSEYEQYLSTIKSKK